MTSPLHDRVEQAYADLAEHKAALSGFERELADSRTTVTAKNRAVSVTVSASGEVQEIKFPTNAYRKMAPTELGQLLVENVGAAQRQARATAASLLESLMPAGMPLLDMLSGPVDLDAMMEETMRAMREATPGSVADGGGGA